MRRAAIICAIGMATLLSACSQPATAPAAPAERAEIFIHVDPATGCHYIVFPNGDGAVRQRDDGTPYCDAPAPAGQ
jgi:hypothetical protein